MSSHSCRVVAAHLLLRRPGQVLMLRRHNTGWEDGKYSVVAGHVEGGESAVGAVIREAYEEAGVSISVEDLEFAHVMHRRKADGDEKLDVWFACDRFTNAPYNAEPEKCDDLKWFSWDGLPQNVVPYVRTVLELIARGAKFSTYYGTELVHSTDQESRLHRFADDVKYC